MLLLLGWLADVTLLERRSSAVEAARAEARETARLGAMTLRAALAELELSIVVGVPSEGVRVERLAMPPSSVPSHGRFVPYFERPSLELVQLLESDRLSPHGFPVAVVAALALERRRAPNAATRKADAAARLLSGMLPVHPQDLSHLAQRLGATDEHRIATLRAILESAPETETLSRFPDFDRTLSDESVNGWSRRGRRRLHYRIPVSVLLHESGVSERVRIAAPSSRNRTPVPGIAGLFVSVEPLRQSPVALSWLRFSLWASVGLLGIGLFVVFRAHQREERAIAREKRFLANVTHELRTPLAAIRVFGESLAKGGATPSNTESSSPRKVSASMGSSTAF